MDHKNENQTIVDLAEKALEPQQISVDLPDGVVASVLALPEGLKIQDLSDLMDNPLRIKENIPLKKPEGLCDYVNKFKRPGTVIFGFPQSPEMFKAAIDYHSPGEPTWREHSAHLRLQSTVPWETWVGAEKNKMNHRQFMNFIQDNIGDIEKPDHADILEKIKAFKSDTNLTAKSEIKGHGEQRDASSETVVSEIPEMLELGLSPYRYVKHYKALARITVNTTEDGVFFSYVITNKERILEAVFDDLEELIKKATDLPIYV